MKFGTKIATLLATAMIMLLGSNLAWAENNNESIEAQDALTFATKQGGELGAKFNQIIDNDIIVCGRMECDTKKEACYKCALTITVLGTGVDHNFYACGDKDNPTVPKLLDALSFDVDFQRLADWLGLDSVKTHVGLGGVNTKTGKGFGTGTAFTCEKVTNSAANYEAHFGTKGKSLLSAQRSLACYSASDKQKYCLYNIKNNELTIAYAEENFRGCEVLPIKLYKHRKCFFCPMFGVIYNAIATVTDTSFSIMAPACATILALGFAIWIAIQVLVQVSSLTKQDAPKFLGSLIKQSYKVVIAFVLLQTPNNLFHYIIRPVVGVGLTFGENMLTTDTAKAFAQMNQDEYGKYTRQAKGKPGGKYYDTSTYDKIEKFVVAVQQEIAFMQATGTSLLCVGSKVMINLDRNWKQNIGDGFMMIVQGAILAIFGFLISIAFVFYLVDGIIQLGVAGGLMPLLLATWPFKPTQKWLGTGANMILNTSFLFMFSGLVVSTCILLISATFSQGTTERAYQELLDCQNLSDYYEKNKDKCDELKNKTNFGGLAQIADALNQQRISKLKDLTDISGMGFLILIFASIFGFKFIGQAPALANKFASGGMGKQIAPSFATVVTSATKSAALKATKDTRESIGKKVSYGIETVASLPGAGVSKLYNFMRGKNKDTSADGSGGSAGGASGGNGGASGKGSAHSSGNSGGVGSGGSGSGKGSAGATPSAAPKDDVAVDDSDTGGSAGTKKQAQKAQQKPTGKHKTKQKSSKKHRKFYKKRK